MATVTRYVNPDSTGGDGTTSATSGATAAYASLSAWEAAEATNLVSDGDIHVVRCAGTSTADTTGVTINGWTTGASNYIEIISDDDPGGIFPSSGYRMVVGSGTACIQNYEENLRVEKLALETTGTTYGLLLRATGTVDYHVRDYIGKGRNGSNEHYGLGLISATGGTLKVRNSLCFDFGTNSNASAFFFAASGATSYCYNNTAWNSRKGFKRSSGTVVAKNCVYQSNGAAGKDGFNGTFDAASDYNLSDVAVDAPGSNSKDSTTVTFVDSANDDFHLDSADTGAKDSGTDLSADSNLAFSDDVDGDTRSGSWDMGFDEVAASVTAAITGTATASITESDIVTGGKTIIITLTGDTFKAAGTGPIGSTADTQALIDGFDAASSPANGWNNEVRDKALTSEVVRTSSTVATWTVAAQSGYDISAQEVITGTIPTAVLVTGAGAITSTPTFTIDAASGFQAAWARNSNSVIQVGM